MTDDEEEEDNDSDESDGSEKELEEWLKEDRIARAREEEQEATKENVDPGWEAVSSTSATPQAKRAKMQSS